MLALVELDALHHVVKLLLTCKSFIIKDKEVFLQATW
jgi:hypothetical protein